MKSIHALALLLPLPLFSFLACQVESQGSNSDGLGGQGGSGEATESCPSGATVVLNDYVSTQIALVDLDGRTLSESLISSASSETDGLSFALSGDVVVPSERPKSGEVVLLDRFGTNVITWVNPKSGKVRAQLAVGTGFESNPQDYVEIGGGRAVVSRAGENGMSGKEPFDQGGDLLFIDTEKPEILSSLALPKDDDFPARPSGMTLMGEEELIVSLGRYSLDFSSTGEAMLVGVSVETQEVLWEETLDGLKDCSRPLVAPDGDTFAVVCTGRLEFDGSIEDLTQSAVLVYDAKERPLRQLKKFPASEVAGGPLQNQAAYLDGQRLLVKTQTALGGDSNNRLLVLNLATGKSSELLEAGLDEDGLGKGLVFGGIACSTACSGTCLMTDADQGVLQVIRLDNDGKVELGEPLKLEETVGLPPVGITFR